MDRVRQDPARALDITKLGYLLSMAYGERIRWDEAGRCYRNKDGDVFVTEQEIAAGIWPPRMTLRA